MSVGSTRPWASLTPIQALIEQACDPTLPEPNHAVNIELAELVNKKKANSARESTFGLLPHINSRNPNQALLALNVLDHLVRNCGYPIHLQISTKDFLNELVRRFPERPPMVTGRVMGRILEMIHEWKNTLCLTSKYKEDLVHIRDMHRLLSYKGYRFKSFDATRALSAANPNETLKSPEELEEEDRAAKSAKLQELIRRATPRDLAAAQELMKQLSGAEPEKAVDYAAQTFHELDKVQSKAILLNDMLNNAREGERIGIVGDAYEQVATACKGARPKIQKWIEEDTGEREGMMDRLLLCNDLINNALERYQACKDGDWALAQALVESSNPNQKAADLISFDAFADEEQGMSGHGGLALPNASGSTSPANAGGMSAGGLPLDLFSSPSPAPQSNDLSSLFSNTSISQPQAPKTDPMSFFNTSTPLQPINQSQPQWQQPPSQHQGPNRAQSPYGMPALQPTSTGSSGFGFATGIAGQQQHQLRSGTPMSAGFVPQQMQPQQAQGYSLGQNGQQRPGGQQQQQQPAKKDAFADLVDLMN